MDARHHSLGFASLTCLNRSLFSMFFHLFPSPSNTDRCNFWGPFLGVPNTGGSTILANFARHERELILKYQPVFVEPHRHFAPSCRVCFWMFFFAKSGRKKHTIVLGGNFFFQITVAQKINSGVTFHKVGWNLRSFIL